ncbi:MAG TPA: SGNH/GDSL hydrolase family protein [Streptosporangiaceae bacterium]
MNRRRRFMLTSLAATAALAPALALALPAGAAQARAHPMTGVNYVALGDSYASGLGAGDYSDGNCDESANAFSVLWANANHPASFANETCSGATTQTVISSQLSPLSSSTTLVSIVIGGNDVGFSNTLVTCVLDSTSACVSAIQTDESEMQTQLPGEMDSVLSDIAADAPAAHVVVLGYPELYDLSQSSSCIGLSTTDRTDLNQAADELDGQIQAAAARNGDSFGDVRSAFDGHQICDSSSWLHSVNFLDVAESYHPTASGQSGGYFPVFSSLAG